MEDIKSNGKWQPTKEDYFKLEEKYRDLENRYIRLYNEYCRKPLQKRTEIMTEKERSAYLGDQKWFECIKPVTNVRKGTGCEVGKKYWFELCYVCDDDDNHTGEFFYRKLSDNYHYDEVYITDEELVNNFKEI